MEGSSGGMSRPSTPQPPPQEAAAGRTRCSHGWPPTRTPRWPRVPPPLRAGPVDSGRDCLQDLPRPALAIAQVALGGRNLEEGTSSPWRPVLTGDTGGGGNRCPARGARESEALLRHVSRAPSAGSKRCLHCRPPVDPIYAIRP